MVTEIVPVPAYEVKRIAIFRALFLGDMICVIPAIRALRAFYSDATITLVGLSWQQDLVLRFPSYFDEFIEFPGWPGLPEQKYDPVECVRFTSAMQEKKFDLVLQMQGNGILTNSMCLLWNSAVTAGLRKEGETYEDERRFIISNDDEHEVLRFLKLTDALGIPRMGSYLEFPLSTTEEGQFHAAVSKVNVRPGQYVCVHPGSRDPARRWSVANFAWIADEVAQLGFTVVLTGSSKETDVINSVAEAMRSRPIKLIDIFENVSLGTLAASIKYSRLLVSNDTGVSHIAAALSVPSVVLFSRYSCQKRWAPERGDLHCAIPFEHSQNRQLVWSKVLDQLLLVSAHVSKQ